MKMSSEVEARHGETMSKKTLLAETNTIWKVADGPDYCPIFLTDPDVRVAANGMSPGRLIPAPKEKASRSTVDYRDPLSGAIRRAEGTIEFKGLQPFLRDPRVTRIDPQFGPLPYIATDGKKRKAFWDARVIYKCGKIILVSFKPAPRAAKAFHQAEVQAMLDQMPDGICDSAIIVTDRDLPAWAVANGRLIHSVLNDPTWLRLDEMAPFARSLSLSMTIEEFCQPFGGMSQTFRTVIKLIASECLRAEPGRINATTKVRSGAWEVHHGNA